MMSLRDLVRTLGWLLPAGRTKNRILTSLGDELHPTVRARSNVVLRVKKIQMGRGSRMGAWNLYKDMNVVQLDENASIGRFNLVSSHPVYKRLYDDGARLHLGGQAKITSRHQIDCSAAVTVGQFASIAGHETKVLTHSVDLKRDAQVAYPVSIGDRSFVGTRCLILGGAILPDNSVLAGGSVLARSKGPAESGIWAGVPATYRGPAGGRWFNRDVTDTRRVYVPSSGETVENAF